MTPLIARKEFKACGIPLCGVYVEENDGDADEFTATVGIFISSLLVLDLNLDRSTN